MKNKLLLIIAIAMLILTACSEAESSEQELYSPLQKERIEKIEAKYEGGFLGRGAYLVVSTNSQTYVVNPSDILNNFSSEDSLVLSKKLEKVDWLIKSTWLVSSTPKPFLELTPDSYKILSEQFTEVTGQTLSHKNITVEDYFE